MGRVFTVAGFQGQSPDVIWPSIKDAETFLTGAPLKYTAGIAEVCADAPTSGIIGIALQPAFSGPGYNVQDGPTVVTGRSQKVSAVVPGRTVVFCGRGVNGGTDPVTPLTSHIGVSYGITAVSGEWVINIADTSTVSVKVVGISVEGGQKLFFFKFLEAAITPL